MKNILLFASLAVSCAGAVDHAEIESSTEESNLSAPSGLSATALSTNSIRLTWTDTSTTEQGFFIERSEQPTGPFSVRGWAEANTTVLDDGFLLKPATRYYYRLYSYDDSFPAVPSARSNVASAVTLGAPTSALRWAARFGRGGDNGHAVRVDREGNVVLAGNSSPAIGGDLFLAKYSPTGNLLWSKFIGGPGIESLEAMAVDASGNIVVAGYFNGIADLGQGTMTSAGNYDVFVAKYSSVGTALWSRRMGSSASDTAHAIAVDAVGDIVVTGSFGGTVDFGRGPLTTASPGGRNGFVVKLAGTNGSTLWADPFRSPSDAQGHGVAVDGRSGDVLVTGSFLSQANLGGENFFGAGDSEIFLVKLAGVSGNHLWSKRFGGPRHDSGNSVAVDPSGNIALTGSFYDTVDFGGGPVSSAFPPDIFVAQYSSTGAHLWSRRIGGDLNNPANSGSDDVGYGVAADATGVAITGSVRSRMVDAGGGILSSTNDQPNVLVAKYSPVGAHLWSKRFAGSADAVGSAIALDNQGGVLATGYFRTGIDFGNGRLFSAGSVDAFLVSLLVP